MENGAINGIDNLISLIRQDIAELLTSRRCPEEIGREFPHVASSIAAYGLPDLTAFSMAVINDREELRQIIERTLELFEPRLKNIRVAPAEVDRERLLIRYRIDARVAIDPCPEFTFETVLRPDVHRLEVVRERG